MTGYFRVTWGNYFREIAPYKSSVNIDFIKKKIVMKNVNEIWEKLIWALDVFGLSLITKWFLISRDNPYLTGVVYF